MSSCAYTKPRRRMSSPIPPPISIAAPRPNNWPAARSRYTAAQLQRNALPIRHQMH
jgi:hypothetical protein